MKAISRHFLVSSLMILMAAGLTSTLKADDQSSTTSSGSSSDNSVSTSTVSAVKPVDPSSDPNNVVSPLPVHFGLDLSETYDDNIFLQPVKTYDYITHISPSLSYTLGDQESSNENYLNLFYMPTFLIYANNTNFDTVEQDALGQYSHTFTKLRLGIAQQYQRLSDATLDTNFIVDRDVYTTTANADYDYSDKLSLHGVATQTITDYTNQTYADTDEWDFNAYFLYDITPKLKLGFGPLVGILDQQFAPHQTYEQFLGHLQYAATGKITLSLSAGVEDRQYEYGPDDQVTPVFDLRGDYKATDSTSLYIDGHAETFASTSLQGQNYQAVSIGGGVQQRLLQKFYFDLGAGYENDGYKALTSSAVSLDRNDNYYFIKTGLDWIPNNWMTVSASYQYSKDDSNYSFASFNDNQYTIRCELKY